MRAISVIVLMLTMPAAFVAAQTQSATKPAGPSEAEKSFEKGRDLLLTGQYAAAAEELAKAVAKDPDKTSYRLALARANCYAGKDAPAREQLEAILKATPDHVEAGQLLGQILAKGKDYEGVLKTLEPLLEYRHDYTTYHLLAEAAGQLGKSDKARKYYQEAVKLNPASASDHYELGNIYLAGSFYALAAESYQKALSLGADGAVLRYKLGSAYFNLRNYFGRIAVATVKSGKAGTISGPWYLVEPVLGKADTFNAAPADSAVYQIAKAMEGGIDRPDIRFLQANIYLNARRYAQARQMLKDLEEKMPKEDKALFYFYSSQAAFGVGEYDEYLSLLEKAIALDKGAYEASRVEAFVRVADKYNQQGNLDKYLEFLQKAVAANPTSAALHLTLGYAWQDLRAYDKAVVQWQMVLDLEPEHADRMKLLNLIEKYRPGAKDTPTTRPTPRKK